MIQSQIEEARLLIRLHHVRPAALIAWSAVEGALIYHATRLDVSMPEDAHPARSPWQLLTYLDSLGYINETDLKGSPNFAASAMRLPISRTPGETPNVRTSSTASA